MTMEQVVAQLQSTRTIYSSSSSCRRIWTRCGSASDQTISAQVRKDTPSLIDVNGFGRPKEFCSKEEDCQQWSKKTEAFFAKMINESENVGVGS